ncbi:hypothetical protein C8J57DRAFT_1246204 [Mycena rebaudengoi]|nr:hypothetical protein C8J57DRAFT_1246204 [Mycena rebaudengoi]
MAAVTSDNTSGSGMRVRGVGAERREHRRIVHDDNHKRKDAPFKYENLIAEKAFRHPDCHRLLALWHLRHTYLHGADARTSPPLPCYGVATAAAAAGAAGTMDDESNAGDTETRKQGGRMVLYADSRTPGRAAKPGTKSRVRCNPTYLHGADARISPPLPCTAGVATAAAANGAAGTMDGDSDAGDAETRKQGGTMVLYADSRTPGRAAKPGTKSRRRRHTAFALVLFTLLPIYLSHYGAPLWLLLVGDTYAAFPLRAWYIRQDAPLTRLACRSWTLDG